MPATPWSIGATMTEYKPLTREERKECWQAINDAREEDGGWWYLPVGIDQILADLDAKAAMVEQLDAEVARLRATLQEIASWQSGFYDNRDNQEAERLSASARDALESKYNPKCTSHEKPK